MKTSITHSKYLTLRSKDDNDPISAKSPAQNIIFKTYSNLILLDHLSTGLCNSWASTSFTFTLDPAFLSKYFYAILVNPLPHVGFNASR